MKIKRKDPFTGKINIIEINITEKQYQNWESGMLIQDAMPKISIEEREFLMSGIMPLSWESHIVQKEPINTTIQKKFFKHLEEIFMARDIKDKVKDILNNKEDL